MSHNFSNKKAKTTFESNVKVESCSDLIVRLKNRNSTLQGDWSTLPNDLLDLILKSLSFHDKLMFKYTCCSWKSIAELHIKSFMIELQNEPPLLLMPTEEEEEEEEEINKHKTYQFDLVKKVQKSLKMPANSHCIGSSQGWLILLQGIQDLFIYNPILDVKFQLPGVLSFPEFIYDPKIFSRLWIRKVIIWGDPVFSQYYGVGVIYSWTREIAYTNHKALEWTLFEDSQDDYCDITVCKDYIYALRNGGLIEAWRINCINCLNPTKAINLTLSPSIPMNISELQENSEFYFAQSYIVESNGEILLVIRCVAKFANPDGEPTLRQDLLEGVSYGYLTKSFYVYKLGLSKKEWIEIKDLGDRMLFVGGNHSKSLSIKDYKGFKENSIYFTDEFIWEGMDGEYTYKGHDMGIFDLGDRSIHEIYDCKFDYKMTPGFWILQN